MHKLFFLLALLATAQPLKAQPTEKIRFDTRLQLQLSGDYHLPKGSRIFFRSASGMKLAASDPSSNTFPTDQQILTLGYEHFFNGNWAGGLHQQLELNRNRDAIWRTRAHLRHVGNLGSLFLDKQIDWGFNYGAGTVSSTPQTVGFHFRAAYPIQLSEKHRLLPTAALYLATDIRSADDNGQHRRFSRSTTRFDLLFIPHPKWMLGTYFANEVRYFFALAQFDENMQQTKPFRRINLVTPHIGLTLRHLWNADKKPSKLFNTVE